MLASWLLLLGGIEIVLGGLMTAYPTLLPQWAGLVIVGIGVLTIVAAVTNIGRDVWQWVLGKAHAQYQALHPGPATTAVRKPWVEFREEIIAATCPDADRWTALLQSFQQAALDGEVRLYGRNDPSYAYRGHLPPPLVAIPADYFEERFMPVLEAVFQPANKAVFICKGSDPDRDAGRVFSDIHVEEAAARAWLARQ